MAMSTKAKNWRSMGDTKVVTKIDILMYFNNLLTRRRLCLGQLFSFFSSLSTLYSLWLWFKLRIMCILFKFFISFCFESRYTFFHSICAAFIVEFFFLTFMKSVKFCICSHKEWIRFRQQSRPSLMMMKILFLRSINSQTQVDSRGLIKTFFSSSYSWSFIFFSSIGFISLYASSENDEILYWWKIELIDMIL